MQVVKWQHFICMFHSDNTVVGVQSVVYTLTQENTNTHVFSSHRKSHMYVKKDANNCVMRP